jgi:signal recognition particle subunit SRP68
MAMKSAQSAETTHKPMAGSTRRQIASRLNKAITYADNLVEVLKDQATTHSNATDILEAQAYLSLLKGALHFEKQRWQACLQEYSIARLIYVTLGASSKTEVFKDLLSSTIDPSIRYAAYQLKVPRTKPVPHLAVENFPSYESSTRKEIEGLNPKAFDVDEESKTTSGVGTSDIPATLSWRGRTVKIEDAAISQALGLAVMRETDLALKAKSYEAGTTSAEEFAVAYDDIINARQEAVDATKDAISEMLTEGVDPSDNRMQSLQITRTAVNYAVIEWRVGRNRILCGPSDGMLFEPIQSKPKRKTDKDSRPRQTKDETIGRRLARLRERVALYDAILQSIDTVKELPGVTRETQFVEELTGKRSYFQALR